MANDYLRYKWRLWFKAIDVKGEGKIYREDKKEEGDRFLEVNYFDERQRRKIYDSLNRIYNDYVFRGKHGQLTEDEFVVMHERDFVADKDAFKEKMRICGELIYGICDFHGKGALTEEDFVHAVTLGNTEHVEKVKAIFCSYNPFGGDISIKILIEAWVQFSTCEDSTKEDIIRLGLETTVNGTSSYHE